jgi:hypothetical protein
MREKLKMNANEIATEAKNQLVQLTGLMPAVVSSLTKDEGGWRITVELIEMKRIPEANDLLATYDIQMDDLGNLLRYQRTRRYLRGATMEESA